MIREQYAGLALRYPIFIIGRNLLASLGFPFGPTRRYPP